MRRIGSILLFLLAIGILLISTWPLPADKSAWEISDPALPSLHYRLTLDWPRAIRIGELRTANLTIQLPPGNSAAAFLSARLELTGMATDPPAEISQALNPWGTARMQWKIRPLQTGPQTGTLWIYRLPPSGEAQVLAARPLSLRAIRVSLVSLPVFRLLAFLLLASAVVLTAIRQKRFRNNLK